MSFSRHVYTRSAASTQVLGDPQRIQDVCSKTLIPRQEYLTADFAEEIMG